jgi:hypothetical protein
MSGLQSVITDAEIETVARAICEGHGYDPDELWVDDGAAVYCKVPAWWLMRVQATTQIAAYRAIEKMRFENTKMAFTELSRAQRAQAGTNPPT